MKFNWGTGIALFYTLFVLALVFQVIKSTQYDNSLVTKDYYAEDQRYQEHYVKLLNSQSLQQDVAFKRGIHSVEVLFPGDMTGISGDVFLFCPSDSRQDKHIPIATDSANSMSIPLEGLKRGKWTLKVDWKSGDTPYYIEEVLII